MECNVLVVRPSRSPLKSGANPENCRRSPDRANGKAAWLLLPWVSGYFSAAGLPTYLPTYLGSPVIAQLPDIGTVGCAATSFLD